MIGIPNEQGRRFFSAVEGANRMFELEQLTFDAANLGEGPCWHAKEQVLYWVDIWGKSLHRYDPGSRVDQKWDIGQMVGTVAPRESGGLLLALEEGFGFFDPATGRLEPLEKIEPDPATRFNDGKCDPAGRFWCGSMDRQEESPVGTLYRMDPDLQVHIIEKNVTISNGMAWSPDGTVMYYIDSPTKTVFGYDYDIVTGNVRGRRPVIVLGPHDGFPDGMTVDAEGMLWVAQWGAGCVGRWNPLTGQMVSRFEVPAMQTSACCFGGKELTDLYITTARKELTDEQLFHRPLSGCLFRLRTNVQGSPTFAFAG
jgi:sugar lactone lactonase YvrE